jgi:DNA-binding CsgD family transcriptional regulator
VLQARLTLPPPSPRVDRAATPPAATGGMPARTLLDSACRLELIFCRFRYAVAILAFLMAAGRPPLSPAAVLALLLIPAAAHIGVWAGLRRVDTLASARRLGHRVLAVDAVIAVTTYLVFLRDPAAIPAAFVPLLVFELAVRFEGRGGIAAGTTVFAVAVGVRIYYQIQVIPGGSLRWPLLLVWVLLAVLITVLARELRTQTRMRLAALRDRERIADSFQLVVGEVLIRSGVPPHAATWEDVLAAVRALCAQEIVRLLGLGYPYERIARTLFVSSSTVRNHVHNIRSKLGLSTREEVIAFARENGLTPCHPAPRPARGGR